MRHLGVRAIALWLAATAPLVAAAESPWRLVPSTGRTEGTRSRTLHLPAGSFDPRGRVPELPVGLRLRPSESRAPGVPWIVQFESVPGHAEREALEVRGLHVLGYVPDNAWVVRGAGVSSLADQPGVEWVGALHPGYRMAPDLFTRLAAAGKPLPLRVVLFDAQERDAVIAALETAGATVPESALSRDDPRVYFTGGPEAARAAVRLDAVRTVELVPTDYEPLNDESRSVIQSGSVSGGAIYHQAGISGAGQIVGLMDEGLNLDTLLLSDTDLEAGFPGPAHRKVHGYSSLWGDGDTCACTAAGGFSHGTMAAQAIAGGIPSPPTGSFGPQAGIAPESRIYFQDAKIAGGTSCADPMDGSLNLPSPLDLAFIQFRSVVPPSTCEAGGVCSLDPALPCSSDTDCTLQDRQGLLWVGPFGSAAGGYCVGASDADEHLWNVRDTMLFFPAGNSAGEVRCPATAKNAVSAGGHYQHPHLDIYGAVNGSGPDPAPSCLRFGGSCATDADCTADTCVNGYCSMSHGACAVTADCVQDYCGITASRRTHPTLLAPACDLPGVGDLSISGQQSDSCLNEPAAPPSSSVRDGICGTSFASAYLAGAGALVRDYYRQGFHEGCAEPGGTTCGQADPADGVSPSGALVKATLLNSGEFIAPEDCPDCGGILGGQGLGRVNLSRTLPLASHPETPGSIHFLDTVQDGSLVPGLPDGYDLSATYYVADAGEELRATVVWMDRGSYGPTLSNRIRVRLQGPTETYYGNNFGGYCSISTAVCSEDADCPAAGETCLPPRDTTVPVSAGGLLGDRDNTFSTVRIAPEELTVGTWKVWVDSVTIPLPDARYVCPSELCGVDLPTLPFALVVTGAGFETSTPDDDDDGDGVPNFGDNCPRVANGDLEDAQADDDADGVGNLCDSCPQQPNGNQLDADGDGVGDACDNCPDTPLPDQQDDDGDGAGNVCDCAPVDPTTWEPAGAATGLTLDKAVGGSTELAWTGPSGPGPGAVVYDVLRSSTPDFESGSACLESDSTDTSAFDPADPAPGEVAFYVVRPENSCGTGSMGTTSAGVERVLLSGGCGP